MLNAQEIYKLLIEGELPPEVSPESFPDDEDPSLALDRYVNAPPPVLRGSPVALYQKWKDKLRGRRSVKFSSIRSTWIVDIPEENAVGLKYHETVVVWVDSGNNVVVQTGGWHTRTTLERINMAAPGGWQIYGRKTRDRSHRDWDFYWYNWSVRNEWNGQFPYTDGDVIKADGTLYPQAQPVYKKV